MVQPRPTYILGYSYSVLYSTRVQDTLVQDGHKITTGPALASRSFTKQYNGHPARVDLGPGTTNPTTARSVVGRERDSRPLNFKAAVVAVGLNCSPLDEVTVTRNAKLGKSKSQEHPAGFLLNILQNPLRLAGSRCTLSSYSDGVSIV